MSQCRPCFCSGVASGRRTAEEFFCSRDALDDEMSRIFRVVGPRRAEQFQTLSGVAKVVVSPSEERSRDTDVAHFDIVMVPVQAQASRNDFDLFGFVRPVESTEVSKPSGEPDGLILRTF